MLATLMAGLRAAERIFMAIVMIAMSVLFFLNVMARQLYPELASEFVWIEEATLYLLAWMVFVGLGYTLERRRHIAMSVFLDSRSPRVAAVIQKLINLTGLVFSIFLTKASFDLAVFIFNSGQVSPTLGISVVGLYAPLPLGFALLSLRYLLELIGIQDRSVLRDVIADH